MSGTEGTVAAVPSTPVVRELCRFPAGHLGRPCPVYACPNGHGLFTHYAFNAAVCWCCPDCGAAGVHQAPR